jgi:hypothetical protein
MITCSSSSEIKMRLPWQLVRFQKGNPGLIDSFLSLEKLVEFVRNLIRKQQHGAVGVNALHVSPNNACHLSRGDHDPRCFPILSPAQVQHLLSEFFLRLRRQIGTQNTQACPYGFDTLACGNLDSCPFLGTQVAVSTHARVYLINNSENLH